MASQIKATETFENAKKQKQEIVADLRFPATGRQRRKSRKSEFQSRKNRKNLTVPTRDISKKVRRFLRCRERSRDFKKRLKRRKP